MKAYILNEYGSNARFVPANIDKPFIREGHVIIEVKATSLNPADFKLRTEDLGINPDLPAILHMDVAGVITEVGEDVAGFKIGDEVYGCAGGLKGIDGALADFMLADANLIALKPKSLSFAEAAALPLVSITAWEGLQDKVTLNKGDRVLIHGGTGGVGHIALQLAKLSGAKVSVTVSSDEKAKIARDLGADATIDYRQEKVEDYVARLSNGEGFDVVFDTVGGEVLDKSLTASSSYGCVISTIGHNTHDLTQMHMKSLSLHLVFMLLPMLTGQNRTHHGHILREIATLVDNGKIKPLIDKRSFSFDRANEAHALFASGQHIGKIVLTNS